MVDLLFRGRFVLALYYLVLIPLWSFLWLYSLTLHYFFFFVTWSYSLHSSLSHDHIPFILHLRMIIFLHILHLHLIVFLYSASSRGHILLLKTFKSSCSLLHYHSHIPSIYTLRWPYSFNLYFCMILCHHYPPTYHVYPLITFTWSYSLTLGLHMKMLLFSSFSFPLSYIFILFSHMVTYSFTLQPSHDRKPPHLHTIIFTQSTLPPHHIPDTQHQQNYVSLIRMKLSTWKIALACKVDARGKNNQSG